MKTSVSVTHSPETFAGHNSRSSDSRRPNVDPEMTQFNIVFRNETLEEAFEKKFGDSVRTHDSAKGRKSRDKIDKKNIGAGKAYLEKMKKDGNQKNKKGEQKRIGEEYIIGLGNMRTHIADRNTKEGRAFIKEVFQAIFDRLEAKFPGLYPYQAWVHLDEFATVGPAYEMGEDGKPLKDENGKYVLAKEQPADLGQKLPGHEHMHFSFIWVGTGYKKGKMPGMEYRYSEKKALENMKILSKDTRGKDGPILLQAEIQKTVAEVIKEYGLERQVMGIHRSHIPVVEEYKVMASTIDMLKEEKNRAQEQIREVTAYTEAVIEQKNAEIEQKNLELSAVQADLDAKDNKIAELESQIDELDTAKDELEAAKSELETVFMDELRQQDETTRQLKTVLDKLDTALETITALDEENLDLDAASLSPQPLEKDLKDLTNFAAVLSGEKTSPQMPEHELDGKEVISIPRGTARRMATCMRTITKLVEAVQPVYNLISTIKQGILSKFRARRRKPDLASVLTPEETRFYEKYHDHKTSLFSQQGEKGIMRLAAIQKKIDAVANINSKPKTRTNENRKTK